MTDSRETDPSTVPAVEWPSRFVGVAAGVVDPAGRILLVRHTYGALNWELPGGMSEPGESRPITDFTVRRIHDVLTGSPPHGVVAIEPIKLLG